MRVSRRIMTLAASAVLLVGCGDGGGATSVDTVVTSGPCSVDKDLPGLACGPLAQGKELKFNMTAQPRNAGNFTFKFHIGNSGRYLDEADGQGYTYSRTQTGVARLRILVDDPVALIERARDLLDRTAERLI